MKKVLFITAFAPSEKDPAEKNTKMMLEDLSGNFMVDLVYFADKTAGEYIPGNENIKIVKFIPNSKKYRVRNALLTPYLHPIFTVRFDKRILKWLQERIDVENYDALVFDHSQTFIYARRLRTSAVKCLLSHDIEAQRVERSSNKLMQRLCLATEKYVLSTPNAKLFALCQKDVDLIKKLYGLDANISYNYIEDRIIKSVPDKSNGEYVMIGSWRRPDNFEGAIWLLNGLSQHLKTSITINIIGKNFPVEKLTPANNIKLNVLGFVDNPYPLIASCKAMLCPQLSGAGIKTKVLESMACGTPVIGNYLAFEGFSNKFESFMLRCNDVESFAQEIGRIDFSLEERIIFKNMIISEYTKTTIPKWLCTYFGINNIL